MRILLRTTVVFVWLHVFYPLLAEPIIPTDLRFQENDKYASQYAGRLLWNELKCNACHESTGVDATSARQAPILTQVASRVKATHLEQFILDPHKTKPGTTMPSLLHGADDAQAKAKALTHYLVSLSPKPPEQAYATFGGRARGEQLFHSVGCVGCHNAKNKQWRTSVPLGELSSKYTLATLAQFLQDPHASRPAGRMPSVNLTSREAADIASYLLPDVPEKAGITYEYFEIESMERLPDFDKLTPKSTGATTKIGFEAIQRRERFALRFQGALNLAKTGEYRFFLGSDDGSRLLIDNKVVIDVDGIHGMKRKTAQVELTAGRHAVTIEYFEKDGQEELQASFAPPGGSPRPLANELVASAPQDPLEELSFSVDPELAQNGSKLFASLGCANCHDVGKPIDLPTKTKTRDTVAGCLANEVPNGSPDFQLSDRQRKALRDLASQQPAALSPEQEIQLTMLQFNCLACHQRGELGGVEQERTEYFQTTQKEMGIEGSIPPHLNGVGGKLTAVWLQNILAEGAKDRPYMLTRMPKFGKENVGHLSDALAKADAESPLSPMALKRKQAKKIGHRLVGEKGFSCIKCHTFGKHKATGVQSIDMTIMTKRLREDWFRQYVRNPQAYRPGTRMPSAWPLEGKSYLPDLLEGDCDKQIAAVWTFLKDGKAARTPAGLTTGSMELIPIDEAIIYRNFIADAGPRAIGVGYPDGLHLAFDANDLRLALVWKGAFMNARRHWTGRGQGFEPPAGQDVKKLVAGVPIASLPSVDTAWPSKGARELAGYQFRGYRLDELQYPTFLYEIGTLQVADKTATYSTDVSTTLRRQIEIKGDVEDNTFFRLATGKVMRSGDRFELENGLAIRVLSSEDPPQIRKSGDLVIPLAKPQLIQLEYVW